MARKREFWFEFSWMGGWHPCSWEGLVVLLGGVGGFLGCVSMAMWMAERMPNSDLVLIPVALAFLDFGVFFYLLFTHTRTRRQAREDEANHTARRQFRTPR